MLHYNCFSKSRSVNKLLDSISYNTPSLGNVIFIFDVINGLK